MAGETLPEQRTEMPTDRRMTELRREGAIFHSVDLEQVCVLLAGFYALSLAWNGLYEKLLLIIQKSFYLIQRREPLDIADLVNGFHLLLLLILPNILIVTGCVAAVAGLSVMLQTNWNRKGTWISLRWDFLNPIRGIQKIFSLGGLFNVGKAILKLSIILPIGYYALLDYAPQMVRLVHMSLTDLFHVAGSALSHVFWRLMYVLLFFAAVDWGYGKFQWLRNHKMTKEEVKDERKAIEGDETTRRKIIAKAMQRATQRLKQTVPKATVVVTNPTHYAVALRYERNETAAPIIVAKGTDFMAQRIREIARENGIPVLERKALARALYASTEVGSEIPRELFKAVAEVLAYVFKLRAPRGQRPVGS